MHSFVATPLNGEFDVKCPHCEFALMTVAPGGDTVHGQTYLLRDGDTLFIGDVVPNDLRTHAWDASFMAGGCPCCAQEYVVYETAMIQNSAASDDWKSECFQYILHNRPVQDRRVFLCTAEATSERAFAPWILERSVTPFGVMDCHLFAPVSLLPRDPIQTPAGISACRALGSNTILDGVALIGALWSCLRTHNLEAQPSTT